MITSTRTLQSVLGLTAVAALLSACGSGNDGPVGTTLLPAGSTMDVAILETSDIHSNVVGYDYYKLAEDKSYGLDRTATLIANARKQWANSLLFDNGDTIQGTVLSDYQALINPVQCSDMLAVYKQMNQLGYDAGTIGNHEFNYGLPFLSQVTNTDFKLAGISKGTSKTNPGNAATCAAPSFPFVSANVVSAATQTPIFKPYQILERTFKAKDANGKLFDATIKVGVIGFAPPPIMQWDKGNLEGHVLVTGWKETAQKYIPEMKAAGADIIVALAHGGIDMVTPYAPDMENGAGYLSQVPGIDVLLTGHQHLLFPDNSGKSTFAGQPGVDVVNGFINGVPTVQPGQWGNNLGTVQLQLAYADGKWSINKTATKVARQTTLLTAAAGTTATTYVTPDTSLEALVQSVNDATIAYVKTPIGTASFDMSTYYALQGDVSALQIVNMAQIDYLKSYVAANNPSWGNLPVLSAAAPFKGGRNGPGDFTFVKQGPIAINNAADLYLYPNTLQVVRVSGDIVRQWLEMSAQQFNQIDISKTEAQQLVNTAFPTFNFDVLYAEGNKLQYQIDVTKPVGSRVTNLSYNGAALDLNAQFLVVTNNYRASGGGNFPGLVGGTGDIVLKAPDASRDVLINYIKRANTLDLATYGSARSWSFVKTATPSGPVVFSSVASSLALATAHGVTNLSVYSTTPDPVTSLTQYQLNLAQ